MPFPQVNTGGMPQIDTSRHSVVDSARQRASADRGGVFAPEKSAMEAGVIGGIFLMIVAVVWLVVGLAAGYLFYYPPVLFILGLIAVIKGAMDSGQRRRSQRYRHRRY